jgi:arginyl-tRNA synthetase
MLSALARSIETVLLREIETRYGLRYENLNFSVPPSIELGELALPTAFDLSRKVRRPPRELAQELAVHAQSIPGVWKVDVAGAGYVNIYLDRASVAQRLSESVAIKLHGRSPGSGSAGKVIVEHTNINPNKAAHIGHLRNAALGDTLVRCLRFLGQEVEVQNYLDNTGVQVADVVVGLQRMEGRNLEEIASIPGKFDYYCWDVYAKVAAFYAQSPENRQWRSLTLQAIEAGGNPTAALAEHVVTRIVKAHLATMARINVHYDLLPRESEILHLRFWDKAFQLLKERDAIQYVEDGKNRGCWVMRTGDRGVPTESENIPEAPEEDEKVIIRSDGTVTYVGKDIAYQLWKFGLLGLDFHYCPFDSCNGRPLWITCTEEPSGVTPPHFGGAQRVYNVIDCRQSYLQGIVLQGLRALGREEEARNSIHFSYEMVALTPACCEELGFKLSEEEKKRPFMEVAGRKGLGVKADDLLDALMRKALAEVRARHDLPSDEEDRIAGAIAVAALRYFLLRFARNTIIAFDFKEALSFEGETGPYVQYAVVRADNIFRKLEETGGGSPLPAHMLEKPILEEFLKRHDDIWELVHLAARLPEVVRQVAQSLEISKLGKYVFSLAQKFNLFYHKYHILSEPDRQRRQCLLAVVDLVRRQMTKALELLGCEVPSKM